MCNNITPEQIFRACKNALGFDVKTESRDKNSAYARFIVIKMLLDDGNSYDRIAYLINRNISTVYFGERRYNRLIKENNGEFTAILHKIKKEMEGLCVSK